MVGRIIRLEWVRSSNPNLFSEIGLKVGLLINNYNWNSKRLVSKEPRSPFAEATGCSPFTIQKLGG